MNKYVENKIESIKWREKWAQLKSTEREKEIEMKKTESEEK